MQLPAAAAYTGRQTYVLNKNFEFLCVTQFKSFSAVKGTSINKCFYSSFIFLLGAVIVGTHPGRQKS